MTKGCSTSDAAEMYRNVMALYGEWLVHAPGAFNQWLHSIVFTKSKELFKESFQAALPSPILTPQTTTRT